MIAKLVCNGMFLHGLSGDRQQEHSTVYHNLQIQVKSMLVSCC